MIFFSKQLSVDFCIILFYNQSTEIDLGGRGGDVQHNSFFAISHIQSPAYGQSSHLLSRYRVSKKGDVVKECQFSEIFLTFLNIDQKNCAKAIRGGLGQIRGFFSIRSMLKFNSFLI